jgi:hypothetical protein
MRYTWSMGKRPCGFTGCGKPLASRGYCYGHYDQLMRGIELKPLGRYRSGECSVADCTEPHRSLGWCAFHYGRWRRFGDPLAEPVPRRRWEPGPCDFPGCTNVRGGGRWYCPPHARQLLRGEELRPLPPRETTRKYAIDHHFFDQIDTEEKAYWLGFITADGCIVHKGALAVNLATADAGHLEKLNASLSADYPLRFGRSNKSRHGMARWHASSIPMIDALGALGVTPRKSATAAPWTGPAGLMRHYWRGMVDGDGGMSSSRGRREESPRQWRIYLTGSQACVEAFGRWAGDICGSRAQSRLNGHSAQCWQWITGGNRMTQMLVRELYDDCTVSLDRKQALADTILAMATPS